jgi:hypothetical protein
MPALLTAIFFLLSVFSGQDAPSKAQHQSSIMWREGDPSRVQCYDNSKAKRDWPLPGPECAKQVFAKFGEPFMFPPQNGIAYGISSAPDNPSNLSLWVDNQTPAPQYFLLCCISTVLDHIDIYDERKHRILSESDKFEQKARAEGRPTAKACSCSGWATIPPHIVAYLGSADLSRGYALPPGKYTVSERKPAGDANFNTESPGNSVPPGLSVSIP